MKNLKTVIVLIAVLLCTQLLVAQSNPTFIIKGGVSSASLLMEDDYDTYAKIGDNRFGYSLGAAMEYPINEIINFETALMLVRKGSKLEDGGVTQEISPLYLEIPFGLKFVRPLDNVSLYGTLGAYLGLGIGGKIELSGKEDGISVSVSQDINWGSDRKDDLKVVDFGGNLGAGLIFDQFEVGLYTSTSFINISAYTSEGATIRNFAFGLMVGYRL